MEIAIALITGIVLVGIAFSLFIKTKNSKEDIKNTIKEILPELTRSTTEQLITIANEKLGAEKKEIRADMEGKRAEIERLIRLIQDDLKDSKEKLTVEAKERVDMFSNLKSALEQQKEIAQDLKVNTDHLKRVLSNNQIRGAFGEQIADELLKMSGFTRGVDYEFNKEQADSKTRPDFAVFLPDRTRVNVDAKFPFANLQKAIETEDRDQAKEHFKSFERDVKEKIKQVTSRDYINPEDRTVDFVILFIPNEMIFSYIYDKLNDVWKDAMEKKVILTGPFSFTALLRIIKQSYENFRVQENIQKIVGYVRGLEKEFGMFSDEFDKVGDKIDSLSKQYEIVGRTRVNQMNKIMDKVRLNDSVNEESQSKLIG